MLLGLCPPASGSVYLQAKVLININNEGINYH